VLAAPQILITANVVVAETAAEAQALARPQLQRMAFMRSGRPMLPLSTVEDAAATATTAAEEQLIADMRPAWTTRSGVLLATACSQRAWTSAR
jgi:alkanesulfonate monooxygenase SsuD/methylene tetrahydromethanopterin reductase-like flavin-dependent oxidoreductase (luciferase family)